MKETEELRRRIMEVLEYDPETGLFRWLNPRKGMQKKGWFQPTQGSGRRIIRCFGKNRQASHLAWMLQTGDFPDGWIQFHDRDTQNLKFSNMYTNSREVIEKSDLTVEALRRCLDYDKETGLFRWVLMINPKCREGWFNGCPSKKGSSHYSITIFGTRYQAHQLAWFWVHGVFGEPEIDHKDGDGRNNRIENLRVATHQENLRNLKRAKNNTSGCTGVTRQCTGKKWVAQIKVDGNMVYLGCFDLFEDAVVARKAAELKYGFSVNHGRNPVR